MIRRTEERQSNRLATLPMIGIRPHQERQWEREKDRVKDRSCVLRVTLTTPEDRPPAA